MNSPPKAQEEHFGVSDSDFSPERITPDRALARGKIYAC